PIVWLVTVGVAVITVLVVFGRLGSSSSSPLPPSSPQAVARPNATLTYKGRPKGENDKARFRANIFILQKTTGLSIQLEPKPREARTTPGSPTRAHSESAKFSSNPLG